jgi:hypothetical protein
MSKSGGAYLAAKTPALAGRVSKIFAKADDLADFFKAGKKLEHVDIPDGATGNIKQVAKRNADESIENIYEESPKGSKNYTKICGSCLAQNTAVFGTNATLESLKPLTSVQTLEKDGSIGQRNVWGKVGRKVSEVTKIWLNGEAIKSTLDHEFISKTGKIVASQIRKGTLLFSLALQSFVPVDSGFIVQEPTQVEGLMFDGVEAYGIGTLGIATAPSNGWCVKGFSLAYHKKFNDWVITQPNFKFKGLVGDDAIKAYIQKLETVLDGKTVEGIVENEMGLLIKTNGSTYGVHKNINGNYADDLEEIFEYKAVYKDAEYPHSTNGLCMNFEDVPNALYDVGNSGKKNIVRIKMKGYRKGEGGDFHEANIQAGFATRGDPNGLIEAPDGPNGEKYTWHHLDDFDPVTGECTMQLVKTEFHKLKAGKNRTHTGSVKQYEFYHNKKYVKPSTDTECDN